MGRRWLARALALGVACLIVFGSASVALAVQQQYDGDTIQMFVQDTARPTVRAKSSTGGGYVDQYYLGWSPGSVSWGSVLYLNDGGWASYGDGYARPGFNAVSNVTNAVTGGTEIVTVVDAGSTGVQMTQRFTHKTGERFITKEWTIHNWGSTTFTGARFYHGGDTYFGGADSARGYFDPTKSMVYIRNNDYTNWGVMGFYANPGTPATRYFEGGYGTNVGYMTAMADLPNTVNSSYVDAGYSLEWDRASLAPGDTWTILSYEIWTPGGALQMIAPGTQNAVADSTVTLPFTVQNLGGTPMSLNLVAASDAGWATSIGGGGSVTVPANSTSIVNVEVEVPAGATGASSISLSASGDAVGTAATTLNIVSLDLDIGPDNVDFGAVPSGDATSQLITVTNNSAAPVTFGTVTAIAPFGTSSDALSGVTLAPGASATVRVTFSSGSPGTFTGSLNIPVTSPTLITRTVPLSATVASSHLVTFQTDGTSGAILTGNTSQPVADGADATPVNASAPVGYHFVNWTGTGGFVTTTNNPVTVTNVTQNMTLTANYAIDSYTLAYHPGANGSLSGMLSQTVTYGGSGTLVTATGNTGYHFATWSDGYPTAARTDTNVSASISATATFAINQYALRYSAGSNGSISGVTSQTVSHGSSGTLVTAVPGVGYHFASWSDGYPTAARTDTNVTGPITATASFVINTYTLSYSAGPNGTLSGATTQTVNHGSSGTPVTATGAYGYHFVSWNDGVMTATRTDANVTYSINPVANFAINMYSLSYTAGPGGTITGSGAQSVAHGASGTQVGALPHPGYHFVSWSDGVMTATRTDGNIVASLGVSANFAINVYTVSYTAGAGGYISGATAQSVPYGGSGMQVIAIPNPGFRFVAWSDGVPTASRADNFVTGSISVTANFEVDAFSFGYSVGAGGGGTISGANPQTVPVGQQGTPVTAVPNPHYHFVRWSDGVTTATRSDVAAEGGIDVTATFAIDTYTLTYAAGSGGSVSGASPQTVPYGGDGAQVTAVPDSGYRFIGWSDGVATVARREMGVTAALSVTAEFEFAVSRFGGADRFGVASGVAGELCPGWADVHHVIIVSGSDRAAADPITAGPLAGAYDAPILLVREDRSDLPVDTAAALRAIATANPGRIDVHIVGGPGSVPEGLRAKVVAAMPSAVVERIGGADRYAVAANVASRLKTVLAGQGHTVGALLLASGQSSAGLYSALALAPVGAHNGMPILLVKGASVPAATTAAIARMGVAGSARYVAGPASVVSAGVLRAVGAPAGNRIASATDGSRSGTAVAIAETALAKGWLTIDAVGLANKLPDAMTGGTLMGSLGGPLLYTEADVLDASTQAFLESHAGQVGGMKLFGGTASISDAVVAEAQNALH